MKSYTRNRVLLCNKGFTLVELMVIIAIVGILVALGSPSFKGYIERTNYKVCQANCAQMVRLFHTLVNEDENRASKFIEFKNEYGEMCPSDGEIIYKNGKVICLLHFDNDEGSGGDDGEEKPYL